MAKKIKKKTARKAAGKTHRKARATGKQKKHPRAASRKKKHSKVKKILAWLTGRKK